MHDHLPPPPEQKPLPEPKPEPEPQPKPTPSRRQRLTEVLSYLHSRSINVFWDNYLEGDVGQDPRTTRLWVTQPELGLPDPAYYKDHKAVAMYTEVVRSSLVQTYKDLGLPVLDVLDASRMKRLANQVVDLEKDLSKVMWNVFVFSLVVTCIV